jgi:hypothetical protein
MKNRTVMLALVVALCASVALGTLDVAVQFVSPTGSEAPGAIPVVVLLTNAGDVAAAVPRLDVKIMPSGFEAYRENVNVGVGGSQPVSMGVWDYAGGIETCTAWITYPDDTNHTNDTAVVIVGGGGVADRAEKELRSGMSIALWPSPMAGSDLHIEYGLNQAGPASIALFDIQGRAALTRDFVGTRTGQLSLSLSGLSGGVYIVRLDDGRSAVTQKLVVQR